MEKEYIKNKRLFYKHFIRLGQETKRKGLLMIGIIVLGHDHFADGISGSLEMLLGKAENYEKINYLRMTLWRICDLLPK